MKVKDLIKELQDIDEESYIAVSYYTQEHIEELFLDGQELSDDQFNALTDDMTYTVEDFTPSYISEFIQGWLD